MAEIRIPDLGDFEEVEVVEVHVKEGDSIKEGDPILTLETEKASMEASSTDKASMDASLGPPKASSGAALQGLYSLIRRFKGPYIA